VSALAWGLQPPDGATAAWGARAIYTFDHRAAMSNLTKAGKQRVRGRKPARVVDLLHDRQGGVGEPAALTGLAGWINRVGLPWLRAEVDRLRLACDSAQVVTYTDGSYTIAASPKASHGYLYIGAWEVAS